MRVIQVGLIFHLFLFDKAEKRASYILWHFCALQISKINKILIAHLFKIILLLSEQNSSHLLFKAYF